MREGKQTNKQSELIQSSQGWFALGYVLLVILGMLTDTIYYQQFGINIFEYSEVFDFLIAPFKRQETLTLFTIAILVTLAAYFLDSYAEKRFPKFYSKINFNLNTKPWFVWYRLGSFILLFTVLLLLYLLMSSEKRYDDLVEMRQKPDIAITFSSEQKSLLKGRKIGANSKYIFLMDKAKKVHIIPLGGQLESVEILSAND